MYGEVEWPERQQSVKFAGTCCLQFPISNFTCAVRRYGFLLRTLPPNICRPYLATRDVAARVQLRCSYDTISNTGGFSESDIVVLTNTLNRDLSDYDGPDVGFVISPVNIVVAPATQLTCLQLTTPDALTRSGDSGGLTQRGISRILRARVYIRFAHLPHRTT
jgi:hypothetical protein